jgi:protease-4
MTRRAWIVIAVGICCFFIAIILGIILLVSTIGGRTSVPFGAEIALVKIEGVIDDVGKVLDEIDFYRRSPRIKAIVVRIDSPGGGVVASHELYRELMRAREEEGKVIVASMGSVAASGGYYVACAADTIMSNPGTITGSLGVVGTFPNFQQVMRKIGVSMEVVKTGEHKDIGSPYRKMTREDKKILQDLLDDVYYQFIEIVAERRNMDLKDVLNIADGRVFTGQQALERGLVDTLGTLHDAILLAADMVGIEGEPEVAFRKRRAFWLLDLLGDPERELTHIMYQPPRLEYRWY